MKNTAENVRVYAEEVGLEPVQIDGIPEGFSFKYPVLTVGKKKIDRGYIAFIPLRDDTHAKPRIAAATEEELLTQYQEETK